MGCFVLPGLLGLVSMSHATGTSKDGKVGLSLRSALHTFRTTGDISGIPGLSPSSGKAAIRVFVELRDGVVPTEDFQRLGVVVGSASGELITALVPLDAVAEIAGLPEVIRIEAGAPVLYALDLSVRDIRADKVWNHPDWGTIEGDGVLVGTVDTGISLQHDNFRDAQGTRIRYLWDWSLDRECDAASINQQTCAQTDVDGHGTAVMGTLAGNGRADCGQGAPCKGVAPGAGILAVKLGENATSVEVAEAVAVLFAKAEELGLPMVVTLSLSWFSGPRDGSGLDERFISGFPGEGRIVVAAAGNQGVTQEHGEANLTDRKTAQVLFRLFAAPPLAGDLEGWYDWEPSDLGKKIEVRVSCQPLLQPLKPVTEWMEFGEGPQDFEAACGSVRLDHGGETDRARGFSARIGDSDSVTVWVLEFRGEGFGSGNRDIDLWINPLSFPRPAAGQVPLFRFDETVHINPFTNRVECYRKTITPPCTANGVVCVSSYNTRCPSGACNRNLGLSLRDGLQTFSAFSSRGPRRDGLWKPELGAPGQALIVPWIPGKDSYSHDSGFYAAGTSFSSAHVAGTVALMLQLDPLLTPERIVGAVEPSVRSWVYDESRWISDRRGWRGYGKLDALALVDAFFSLPDPPANLVGEVLAEKKVKLTWDPSPSADVTVYRIYWNRGGGSIDYGLPLAEVTVPATAWTSEKLTGGQTYAFGVRAVNPFGEEENTSARVNVRIPAPVPPVNLRAEVVNLRQVQLTWDPSPSTETAFYRIHGDRGSGTIDPALPLETLSATVSSWTSGELSAGIYLFKVVSADADLEGDFANSPTVTASIFASLGTGDDDFCFIASAVFADPFGPEVSRLRELRDRMLRKTSWGRQLVAVYYRTSPPLAAWLKEHEGAACLVRLALRPLVGGVEVAFHRGVFGWAGFPLLTILTFFGYRLFTRWGHQS